MRLGLRIVLFCLVWVFPLLAQKNDRHYQLSFEGIDFAYNMDFAPALERFDALIQLDPGRPKGHLLKAVSHYYLYLIDMSDEKARETFLTLAKQTLEVAQRRLQKQRDDLDALFALGTMNMYLAAFYGESNSWVRAYWYGKEGINYLQALVDREPTYADAYLGLGLYHYYASVMPRLVKAISYLLGMEADRRKGLKELQIAEQQGTYASVEARFFLGYIYLYMEKDFPRALRYFRELCDSYPRNPVFLIVLGDCYRKLGQHDLAIQAFERSTIPENYRKFPRLINSAYYLLGNIYFEKNDLENAIAYYRKAVENSALFPDRDDGVYSWGLYKQGECFEMLGKRELAVSYYRRVQKVDNKYAYQKAQQRLKSPLLKIDADLIRARNYLITRQFDEAIRIYEEVIPQLSEVDTDYPIDKLPELYYDIGRAKYEKKAYEEAIVDFKRVLASGKLKESWLRPWTHYRLGKCYQLLGRHADALEHFKLAYKYDDGELRFEIEKINQELKGSF